jgi:UDP-3-O-[3-hydroxymyristoyl] glucosamine N-acyltransferase
MPAVSIGEIVDFVGGEFVGDRDLAINSVAPLASAASDQLSFLSNRKYASELAQTNAGAVLVPAKLEGRDSRWIRVDNPYFAFAKIMTRWFAHRPKPTGVSPNAVVAESAKLGDNVSLGHFSVIGEDVVIGNNVTIFHGVSIEAGSVVGDDCIIYPNVAIYDGSRI